MDVKKVLSDLDEWAESDDGKAYYDKERTKHLVKKNRFIRFEEWLKHNDFDKLMYRLILEHNLEYCEKCYHRGYEPKPNNKLDFLIEYVVLNNKPIVVPELNNEYGFSNQVWLFKGYYIQMTWGQGVVTDIYNKDDLRHLLNI